MKVYEFFWNEGQYGGGLMIVVAPNEAEAIRLAKAESTSWQFDGELTDLKYTGKQKEAFVMSAGSYQE